METLLIHRAEGPVARASLWLRESYRGYILLCVPTLRLEYDTQVALAMGARLTDVFGSTCLLSPGDTRFTLLHARQCLRTHAEPVLRDFAVVLSTGTAGETPWGDLISRTAATLRAGPVCT